MLLFEPITDTPDVHVTVRPRETYLLEFGGAERGSERLSHELPLSVPQRHECVVEHFVSGPEHLKQAAEP